MKSFWDALGQFARISLVIGVCAILLVMGGLGWWVLRSDYQLLFGDLKPQDAAAMTAELEKLKIPYRYDEETNAIYIDKPQVHATRIKLMGKDLPLHGAVGFELFNNTDFGMTEFAQKINYQRALQGELTRTILSLSEVRDVRVHLALPEQGLFKQATVRPKAAITLTLREGQSLRAEQISGIQRLVAAATPGMLAADVTVVDKQGIALSRSAEDAGDGTASASGSSRLELKKDTEAQLTRKATAVLDKAFGAGQALASVDVTLNMDQSRTTTEDVLPAPTRSGDSRGVVIKEKESVRDGAGTASDVSRSAPNGGTSSQREVDYQVGRRVEQVSTQAGAIRRIQVVAIVRQTLDASQEEKLRRLLAASVGASLDRGDSVVVQSMQGFKSAGMATEVPATLDGHPESTEVLRQPVQSSSHGPEGAAVPELKMLLFLGLAVLLMACIYFGTRRTRSPGRTSLAPPMNEAQRKAALRKVKAWMDASEPSLSSDPVARKNIA